MALCQIKCNYYYKYINNCYHLEVHLDSSLEVPYGSHLHLSRSLVDRWGPTDDLATSSPHSSRLSAFLMAAPSVMPAHSGMLSSHLFFCLPLLIPPYTVPYMIVLVSPVNLATCPYHFSLRRFTVAKRSSCDPTACRVLFRTSSLELWSLYVMPRSLLWHLISMACILLSASAISVQDSQAYMNVDMIRERINLIFELSAIYLFFPDGLEFCECCCGLGDPGENFSCRSFICDDCSQIFEHVDAI